MSALLKISTLSLSFRVCKHLAQSAAVPKSIQTLFLLCHFLQLVNVCCLAHTDSCWRDWPYGCQLPDSLWQRSCAKLTKSNHEKPDSVELNAASTKRQGKVLFFFFFLLKMPRVRLYNMVSGLMQVSGEFSLPPSAQREQRGIWRRKRPRREGKRRLETEWETDTKTAEGERWTGLERQRRTIWN